MNNIRNSENLIQEFKEKFLKETGRGVKVTICNKWESISNFTEKGDIWMMISAIFGYTGWEWDSTFGTKPTKDENSYAGNKKNGFIKRSREKIFRRRVIDYICVNNNITTTELGRETGRDHTTIMHSVSEFSIQLENDFAVQRVFQEILDSIKQTYSLYKNKADLKNRVIKNTL